MRRQYFDAEDSLSLDLRDALLFHKLLASVVPPRIVQISRCLVQPVRIYSDASFEPASPKPAKIGFVVFSSNSALQPIGMSACLSPDVINCLVDRKQQITPCEALLSVIVPANVPHLLAGQDVVWYIDNQAACQALTKGSSSCGDVCAIATLAHLIFARLGCRVYFEYIESEANVSDGLSRLGLSDPWSQQQGWLLSEAVIPDVFFVAAQSLARALTLV